MTQPERDHIRFLLGGRARHLRGVAPTRTVLEYLREEEHRTGTKEGCAEGDCGACTVLTASLNEAGDGLDYHAVNACIQFLPALDGKALLTIEDVAGADGGLHPIQQALVDHHASQCGFCTPGFVMSLYASYQSRRGDAAPPLTAQAIGQLLSGNLCRCTGYRSIVTAALQALHNVAPDLGTLDQDGATETVQQLQAWRASGPLHFTGAGQRFYAPRTIDALTELYAEHPGAIILGGGTDAALWVTKQLRELDTLIAIGEVATLKAITMAHDHIRIGAGVTLTRAAAAISAQYPELEELFLRFASPPIRNAATLAGNIANASPIGDAAPALLALDAELELRSVHGQRTLALSEFFLAYQQTALQPGEIIETLRIPRRTPDLTLAAYKISKRFDQDIAALCAVFRINLADGLITTARAAFGGMAAIPKRASACEAALVQQSFTAKSIEAAAQALQDDFTPIGDLRASAAYRQRVAGNLLRRFLLEHEPGSGPVRITRHGR